MPVRRMLLSLVYAGALTAAMIEPSPADPWAALRTAPPPEMSPDPPDYPVPDLALELGQVLQFVLAWAYTGLDDPDENNAILTALQPQYEAFLNSRRASSIPPPTVVAPLLQVAPLQLAVGPFDALTAVPEPRTWLLLAAGLALVFRNRKLAGLPRS